MVKVRWKMYDGLWKMENVRWLMENGLWLASRKAGSGLSRG